MNKKLKTIYTQSAWRERLDVVYLIFCHLLLFVIFVLLWPLAWLGLYLPILFVSKTPWPKSFDLWAMRVLTAPRDALIPEKENQKLN